MRTGALASVALVAVGLVGCGKEVGRVGFSAPGTADATVTLSAGEVTLWTELDLEWEGDAKMAYAVSLEQDGKPVASATCDPLARAKVRTMWAETNVGDKHTRRGNARMECSVKLEKGGPTVVKASLTLASPPAGLVLRKADLVVKQ